MNELVYLEDIKGWTSVNTNQVNANNKTRIMNQTGKMALVELSKSVGNAAMIAIVALGALITGFLAFKLTSVFIALIAYPTAIISPLYNLLISVGGFASGGLVSYLFIKKYGQTFFNQMQEHFKYSMHLFAECNEVRKVQKMG
jgi:hypothetical protein